jgi:serine/threonine-protein kinase RsbW
MSQADPDIRLAIGSRFENIDLVQVVLEDSMKHLDLEEDTRHWIGIAVREAVANAIKHGNRQAPEKEVEIEIALAPAEVVIRVSDQGEGFDPQEVRDPLDPSNLLRPDGRGIFYMRSFMDEVDYSFTGGTVVTLRKRLSTTTKKNSEQEDQQ